jgi:uncharacterized cupin superfamily protein
MQIEVRKPTEEEINEAENWGAWEKEPSEFSWSYDEQETCLILEGHAVVDGGEGEHAEFGVGDYVIFPVGLQATWKIDQAIKKKYKFG